LDPDAWVVDLNTGGGEFVQVAIRRGARRILGFERRRGLLESAQRRLSPYRLRGWVRLHEPRSTAAPDSRNRGRLALDEILLGLRNPARQWPVQLLKADAGDGNWTALAAAQRLDLVERVCGEFQLHPDERESGGEVHELARSLARFGFMVRWEVSPQANRDGLHLGLYCAERT